MIHNLVYNRRKLLVLTSAFLFCLLFLIGRLFFIIWTKGEDYSKKAKDLQEREREVKAVRGIIYDRNQLQLVINQPVYIISVIHNQIENPEKVIDILSQELHLSRESVQKKVNRVTAIERIKANVDEETGRRLLSYDLKGVKVDLEYKRLYPYESLASKVLGFAGGDYQGILGIEAKYDSVLSGTPGIIYQVTDARGRDVEDQRATLQEPIPGKNLILTLDYTIQTICQSACEQAMIEHEADSVSAIAMDPTNGEIYAMVDLPEYDLNQPFQLQEGANLKEGESLEEQLNYMWRNQCINDTYEPGSTFKIITSSIVLEEKLVSMEETFYCPGYIKVEDRRIRCHKTVGHLGETFEDALKNSCNPVFIQLGQRIGAKRFYQYFERFGLLEKTGIDLAGEAGTIMHKEENIHPVELATISFGQSFQVTPIQLITTVSSLINGGVRVVPHIGKAYMEADGTMVALEYPKGERILSEESSGILRQLLQKVVAEGSGKKAAIEGYEIGGKTATSQTFPRSANKYIASFVGFYPASQPKFVVLVIIRNPKGIYYGGTIAAPLAREILEKAIPYLDK